MQAVETHRIRIVNRAGGAVSVSVDGGRRYVEVARVVRPATATMPGFPAVGGAAPGTVAALALDRWLIRTDEGAADAPAEALPRVLGVAARGEGGGGALAEVDLPPGAPLFTTLAPTVGAHVFRQDGGLLTRLQPGYAPAAGDVWVIVAERPSQLPRELLIENKIDGAVLAIQRQGPVTRVGRVVKPVLGVARYPGTELCRPGQIAAQNPGMILVATPGASGPAPSGFMIQSSVHRAAGTADGPSVLVVEPMTGAGGRDLFMLPIPLRGARGESWVDMRRPGKAWESLPAGRGSDPRLFAEGDRSEATKGPAVERFRLRIGEQDPAGLATILRQSARLASAAPRASGPVYKGRLTISANITGRGIQMVKFLLDGQMRAIDNNPPYSWDWDTRTSVNGEHTIEIQGLDMQGRLINTTKSKVTVTN